MSLVSRMKKLKLKKLQPGRLIKGVVDIAATAGVPGAGAAKKVVDRVGKKVESVDRAFARDRAKYEQVLRETGAGALLDTPATNRDVPMPSENVATTSNPSSNGTMIAVVAIVAVLFFMKGR